MYNKAENIIGASLRELSVYDTILACIAGGCDKLNDLYLKTGFSRAKISVYMKNLAASDIIEKAVSFETGGWENAKREFTGSGITMSISGSALFIRICQLST